MEFIQGVTPKETVEISEIIEKELFDTEVKVTGAIHSIRDMGEVEFVILRKREGLVQCVLEKDAERTYEKDLKEEMTVCIEGTAVREDRAPNGFEIRIKDVKVLSVPAAPMPLAVNKWKLNTSLEANLNYRSLSLRNVRERAKFRIQEGVTRAFRDYLYSEGFTEIHTPKLGAKSAEGGANLFRLEYFHRPAVLQQSERVQ